MEDKRNTEYQMHKGHIQLEQILPAEIENRSFEIIQDELAAMGIRLVDTKEGVHWSRS